MKRRDFLNRIMFLSGLLPLYSKKNLDAGKNPKNVLFIAIDDLNDWIGCLGGHSQARTPNIDKLASDGIVFEKAYCAAPLCGPSRLALMYGVRPHSCGSYGHDAPHDPRKILSPDVLSIPMKYQKHGYYTAGAGKIFHMKFHDKRGWDDYQVNASSKKPDKSSPDYHGKPIAFGPVATDNDSDMGDMKYTEYIIEALKKNRGKSFFLALGLKKPHMPWNAPQKYFDMYDLDNIVLPEVPEKDLDDVPPVARYIAEIGVGFPVPPGGDHAYMISKSLLWKRAVRAYLATSSFADACVGRMISALKKSGQYENTIIVLWGDHGWHLGEKNHWRKHALWERSTKTTFIMRVPGMTRPGSRCKRIVSLADIYPTILELCNLPAHKIEGESLVPLLKDVDHKWDKAALMTFGPGNHSIRFGQWRYTRYLDGSEELYDHVKDPNEYTNLAGQPFAGKIIDKLKRYIPKKDVPDPAGDESKFAVLNKFIK